MYIIWLRGKFTYHSWVEAVLWLIFKQIAQKNFLKGNYNHTLWDKQFPLQTSWPCVDCGLHDHTLSRNWLILSLRSCICCSAYTNVCRTYTAVLLQFVGKDCTRKRTRLHDEVHEVLLNISIPDNEPQGDPICIVCRRNSVGNYHTSSWISDREVGNLYPSVLHIDPILHQKCSSSKGKWKLLKPNQ